MNKDARNIRVIMIPEKEAVERGIAYLPLGDIAIVAGHLEDGGLRVFGKNSPEASELQKIVARAEAGEGIPEPVILPLAAHLFGKAEPDNPAQIITARSFATSEPQETHGAVCVLAKAVQVQLRAAFAGDCILLPSSRHEMLAVPLGDNDAYRKMVRDINATVVADADVLSNEIFLLTESGIRPIWAKAEERLAQ